MLSILDKVPKVTTLQYYYLLVHYYIFALIMNMIMIVADKAIFKVKTSKNSKIFIFEILF